MAVIGLCLFVTLVSSVTPLAINDFTAATSTSHADNTAYEDETFNINLELTFNYMSSDLPVSVQLHLPYSTPESTETCDDMMTGDTQNCHTNTYADVYATVDPSGITATIGSNIVASHDPPGVGVIGDGAIPQALVKIDFGVVHSTVDHSPDSTDVIAITVHVKIKPGFSVVSHLFVANAIVDVENSEKSATLMMRGPFLHIVTRLEQGPYNDIEAGQRLYYSMRIDHLSGSTEDAENGVLTVVFESTDQAPLVSDEEAFYQLSSNPTQEHRFDGNVLFTSGLGLQTPISTGDYIVVYFRRNVTSALQLDSSLRATASVVYDNPSGISFTRTVLHSVGTKPINYTSFSEDVVMTSEFPVGKMIIMRKSFVMPKGTLKNFLIFAQFKSTDLPTIPMLFKNGYSELSVPSFVEVTDTKVVFYGRDFTVATSWQYRRKRSAENDRQKRAAPIVASVTVPYGDIVNPVIGGEAGAIINILLRYPVDLNTTGGDMTVESGIRYSGSKKFMYSGPGYVQHPDLILEKTVEMVDNVTIPNVVRFNVTISHTSVSTGSAHNIQVHDGSEKFSIFWGIQSVGLTIGDPGLQIVDDKILTLSRSRLDNTQELFFSYKAKPALGVELPAGDTYYNATMTYTSSSKPNTGHTFRPDAGSCCIRRVDFIVDDVFTNYGYTLLALMCGVIIGIIIVVLVLFILYFSGCYILGAGGATTYTNAESRRKIHVYAQGLIIDPQVATKKGRVQTIGDLSDDTGEESIVGILASKSKMEILRNLDNQDIIDTVKVDEDIERERERAMIDGTDANIYNLFHNGDINKQTANKCKTTFNRKVRDQDNELNTEYQEDMMALFKTLSAKNKVEMADMLEKQEEETKAEKDKTAGLPEKEQKKMSDSLAKQHEMQISDLVHRLKLEQSEKVEKLRKEYAIRKRIGLKGLQQDVLEDVRVTGKLNAEQYDWLMKEHIKNQSAVEKLFDDEISRQRMMLQEKLARRRLLAERNDMEDDSHNTVLDTMANQTLQIIQKGKKGHHLSAAESKLVMERMTEQMMETKERFDRERREQEMSLHMKLSKRKKKQLADLEKKQQQEVKDLEKKQHTQQTQIFDPVAHLEKKQLLISNQRAEHMALENEIDEENAAELRNLRTDIMVKTKEELVQEKQSIVEKVKQNGMSEEQLNKIISKHNSNLKTLAAQQEEEKQRQQDNFKTRLEENRRSWLQQREQEKEEQAALREHEENIVRSLLSSQVAMSEEERNCVLQEHEKQMVKLENSLTLNKLQQKRMFEERLARKRAQKLEALEKKQLQERKKKKRMVRDDEDDDSDGEMQMLQEHADQRLAILQDEDSLPEDEIEEIREEMMKERANSLKEQEEQLGAMLAQLQLDKAKEMAKIEEQQKAIHNLKSNLMDDLNDKGILSDPQCQKVIEMHQKEQEKLNKKLDSQRSKQEKALKKRLKERLRQKEAMLAQLHEQQLNDELSACASSTAAKLRRIAIKHKHMVEMEQFRNRIDLEISQTLEEMKRQNEVRRLQERQEQEMQFINGLVRLGKFHMNELDHVVEMLFPNKSEEEHRALMDKLCEGYKSPPSTPEGSELGEGSGKQHLSRQDTSLEMRVKSATYRRTSYDTNKLKHAESGESGN